LLHHGCVALSKKTFDAAKKGNKNLIVQLKDNMIVRMFPYFFLSL